MFLGAGSVMHGMDDDVDMRHYGVLRKMMPVTFITFAMGYLAIIGFPGFSGFWSKDKIIEVALADNLVVGIAALLGAAVTGFYMTRLMLMTFFSQKRWRKDVHPHESPAVMTIPLIVLAALSVLGGLLLLNDWIVEWLSPVVGEEVEHDPPIPALAVTGLAVLVVAVGVALAFVLFQRQKVPAVAPTDVSFVTRAARAELYGNEINEGLVVQPGRRLVAGLFVFDRSGADGLFMGGGLGVKALGGVLRRVQTGYVRSYALSILIGVVLVAAAMLAVQI
jgi:NADH-quinone oxidoreductase subunit L